MSPEQAQGEPIDHRSDLFSLGSVLYFACTGRPPFRASSTPAVLRRVCDEQPRPLREVNADIPVWLAEIIERLHAKDSNQRFQTADELAALLARQLGNLQRGLPVELPIAAKAISPRPPIRSKALVAALLAIPAAILIFAMSVFVQPRRGVARAAGSPNLDGVLVTGGQNSQSITITTSDDGVARPTIHGSGVTASKTWDVAGFDSIQIGSTFRTKITKGVVFKVTTSADDNILENIRVAKTDNTLKVGLESGSYQLENPLSAEITMPTIAALDLGGSSKTTLIGFDAERDIKTKLSGASELGGALKAEKAEFVVDGSSKLSLSGSAASARIVANGASHLKLEGFPVKQGDVDLEGSSSARIVVQSESPFRAKLSGASHLSGSVTAGDMRLDLNGSSHAALSGSSKDAEIHANGVSKLDLSEFAVHAGKLRIKLDGSSSIKLSGQADTALLQGNAVSHLDLSGLVAQTADVKLTGSSHATIDARAKLTYDLSSVSHLRYLGEPKELSGKKSGASTVSRGK
jgi:serine/threonine-protein kinase